jgi:hypothetical protein
LRTAVSGCSRAETELRRTLRAAGSHDERSVVAAQLRHTDLSHLVTNARQVAGDERLERLLQVRTGLTLELAAGRLLDVLVGLLVRLAYEAVLLGLQALAGRDVADTDREALVRWVRATAS